MLMLGFGFPAEPQIFGEDDVKTRRRRRFIKLKIRLPLLLALRSLFQTMTAVFRGEQVIIFWWSWTLQASNVRSQRRPARFLNYMRWEREQRLQTGSDTVSPGRAGKVTTRK